jgi:hypothetical protein
MMRTTIQTGTALSERMLPLLPLPFPTASDIFNIPPLSLPSLSSLFSLSSTLSTLYPLSLSFIPRRVWTGDEDEAIRAMVTKYGTKSWALIAENLSKEHSIAGRSGKQCRERWHNHLDPHINKSNWTEEEERVMSEAHKVGRMTCKDLLSVFLSVFLSPPLVPNLVFSPSNTYR